MSFTCQYLNKRVKDESELGKNTLLLDLTGLRALIFYRAIHNDQVNNNRITKKSQLPQTMLQTCGMVQLTLTWSFNMKYTNNPSLKQIPSFFFRLSNVGNLRGFVTVTVPRWWFSGSLPDNLVQWGSKVVLSVRSTFLYIYVFRAPFS